MPGKAVVQPVIDLPQITTPKKSLKQKLKDNAPEIVFWTGMAASTAGCVAYAWWAVATNTPVSMDTVESAGKAVTTIVYKSGRVFTATLTKAVDVAEVAAEAV